MDEDVVVVVGLIVSIIYFRFMSVDSDPLVASSLSYINVHTCEDNIKAGASKVGCTFAVAGVLHQTNIANSENERKKMK